MSSAARLAAPLPTLPCSADAPARLRVHGPNAPGRAAVEAFIARVYAQRFGATLKRFAPCLVSLHDAASGEPVAAAGYRRASEGPLFLERYLSAPVEQVLTARRESPVARAGVVEVGHLAATRAGEGRQLIRCLGLHLAEATEHPPVEWVVSTLTEELRHLFVRLGVTPLALGPALPAAVGEDLPDWGRYYEHHPVVLAGHLRAALRLMERRAGHRVTS